MSRKPNMTKPAQDRRRGALERLERRIGKMPKVGDKQEKRIAEAMTLRGRLAQGA